jgi:hypothetical protein
VTDPLPQPGADAQLTRHSFSRPATYRLLAPPRMVVVLGLPQFARQYAFDALNSGDGAAIATAEDDGVSISV